MSIPRVLVGCPTSDYKAYCLKEYAEAVKNLGYKNYDVLVVDNSETEDYTKILKRHGLKTKRGPFHEGALQRIVDSRNILRQEVLEKGYDYLLSLEQDVIPPRDVIERLLRLRKGIASGIYFNRAKDQMIPLVATDRGMDKLSYVPEEILFSMTGAAKVDYCGLGCVLIHKRVLQKVQFRVDEKKSAFDDWWFCQDAKAAGFEVFALFDLKCTHLLKGRPWQWGKIKL